MAERVDNLISKNQTPSNPVPSMDNYNGPTIPELRKDQDLSELVRAEVQRIITTQLPSLQKNVANYQPVQSDSVQLTNQARVHQQLAEFRAQQKKEMEDFAKKKEQQFLALQDQLQVPWTVHGGGQALGSRPGEMPTYHRPEAVSDHPAYSAMQGAGNNSNLAMDMETLMGLTVRSIQTL